MPGADGPGAEQRPRLREGWHKKEPIREHLFGAACVPAGRGRAGMHKCTRVAPEIFKNLIYGEWPLASTRFPNGKLNIENVVNN